MKKLIRVVVCFFMILFCSASASAISLNSEELRFVNRISRFLDVKPEGASLKMLEKALKSESPFVKGLGAVILYKHYGRSFKRVFHTAFTLNRNIDEFEREDRKFIRLENVNKILENFNQSLGNITDERARRLFLFFHFRHIDLWLVGQSGEKLSMPIFYRISSLESVFGPGVDVIRLSAELDNLKK